MMSNIIYNTILDGVFAGLASIAFSLVNCPPRRVIVYTIILAGLGRSIYFFTTNYYNMSLEWSAFSASLAVGFCGIFIATRIKVPMEVISFPALLPMFPGKHVYNTILGIVNFGASTNIEEKKDLMFTIFDSGIVAISVVLSLAVGVIIPLLIFYEHSFAVTRYKK